MTANSEETISTLELLEIGNGARLGRATEAAERAADALGRIADAFETFNALFASTLGVGRVVCGSDRSTHFGAPVNFIRTGDGRRSFPCDLENADSADTDEN